MASTSLSVKGTTDLIGKLKRNANLDDVKNVVKLNTSEMEKTAKRAAPNDTGHLEREIKQDIKNEGFTGKVASTAEYAEYQEYGTRFQPGTPHIRPAFHEQKLLFLTDMKRLMR